MKICALPSLSATFWAIAVLLSACFFGVASAVRASPPEAVTLPKTVRIGVIASLTGPAGEQGRNWLQGARFAAGELSAEGMPVELIVEDDGTVPVKAVSAFHKLAGASKVQAIIGGTWDFLGEAIYPYGAHYKIPVLTPTNPWEIMSAGASKSAWVFTNGLSLAAERDAIRRYFQRERVRTLALLYPSVPFGESHADLYRELAREHNATIVRDISFVHDGNYHDSIKLAALKIAELKPDVVCTVVDYAGLDLLMQEFERAGVSQRVLTTQHLDQALELSGQPQRFSTVVGVYPAAMLDEDFNARFERAMHTRPRVYTAEGYDAVRFLAGALRAGLQFDSPHVSYEMHGLAGLYRVPPREGRAVVESAAVLMTVRDGVFKQYE